MSDALNYANLEAALSLERFGRYLDWAEGERPRAISLYTLNTRVSESLYVPLQTLEVVLRNRIHSVMATDRGEAWFQGGALLGARQPEQLAKAIQDIRDERKDATSGRIVAALTFSFWTGMFGTVYEELWQKSLHRIGTRPGGKKLTRKDFSAPLTPIRILRNRIAHHEPIIIWDLRKHHDKIVEIIGWLSPSAQEWCRTNDRFEEVYPVDRIALAQVRPAEEGIPN